MLGQTTGRGVHPFGCFPWALFGLLASACGGNVSTATTSDSHAEAGAPSSNDAGELPRDSSAGEPAAGCMPGQATASELASTPRADTNLELLALKLSPGRIVADEAIYQRVVHDVGAIRSARPDLSTIGFFAWSDGRSIMLTAALETSQQMQSGTYHAWDCLNGIYGAIMPFEYIRIGSADQVFVSLKVKGIYAVDLLAKDYGRLPGVMSSEGGGIGGDGPTICVTPGDTAWHYVLDAAGGDCPAGCTEHAYAHFTTQSDGTLMTLETWSGQSGMTRPAWVDQYASRAVCH